MKLLFSDCLSKLKLLALKQTNKNKQLYIKPQGMSTRLHFYGNDLNSKLGFFFGRKCLLFFLLHGKQNSFILSLLGSNKVSLEYFEVLCFG
jgi:hypothetical protein